MKLLNVTRAYLAVLTCTAFLLVLAQGQCRGVKCAHCGKCVPGYKGIGFRCECPNRDLRLYGPLCELASRGFVATDDILPALAVYKLPNEVFNSDQMSITFEFQARCPGGEPRCYLLMITKPDNTPMVRVLMLRKQYDEHDEHNEYYNFDVDSPATKLTTAWSSQFKSGTETNRWLSMGIMFQKVISLAGKVEILTNFSFSLTEFKAEGVAGRITRQELGYDGDLKTSFINSSLVLGGFHGCIRYVRINNKLMDLKFVHRFRRVEGLQWSETINYTSQLCPSSDVSCHLISTKQKTPHRCGINSRCEATLPGGDSKTECSCKCAIGKRRGSETFRDRDRCLANLDKSEDECNLDSPTISTRRKHYKANWTAKDKCIGLDAKVYSVEFLILTLEANVESVLLLNGVMNIKITKGYLELCIHSAHCHSFPPVIVSNDRWHSVSVTFRHGQLNLVADTQTRFYFAESDRYSNTICQCELAIRNSCIRGLRISDFYLPLSNEPEVLNSNGRSILFNKGRGVSIGSHCKFAKTGLTPPTCPQVCKINEECNGHMDSSPECICKEAHSRNSTGTCVKSSSTEPLDELYDEKDDGNNDTNGSAKAAFEWMDFNAGDKLGATSVTTMLIAVLLILARVY